MPPGSSCPCGSRASYDDCCGPIISGAHPAPTAEALMRSRYSAFAEGAIDHIERSLCREEREDFDRDAITEMSRSVDWLKLDILDTDAGGEGDETGTVRFAAHYRQEGIRQVHHERSVFRREDGQWVYVDGDINPRDPPRKVAKVGRNDPCPCGSGKKFKKCCGA